MLLFSGCAHTGTSRNLTGSDTNNEVRLCNVIVSDLLFFHTYCLSFCLFRLPSSEIDTCMRMCVVALPWLGVREKEREIGRDGFSPLFAPPCGEMNVRGCFCSPLTHKHVWSKRRRELQRLADSKFHNNFFADMSSPVVTSSPSFS